MKTNKFLAMALVVGSALSVPAFAGFGDNSLANRDKKNAETVSVTGTVTCRNQKAHEHKDCDLAFVDEKTGDTYTLASRPELQDALCEESGAPGTQVTGTLTDASVFGERKLTANTFVVAEGDCTDEAIPEHAAE